MSDVKPQEAAVEKPDVQMDDATEPTAAPVAEAPKPEASLTEAAAGAELGPLPAVEGKTEAEVGELLSKAAKQVCFYFSDSNLPVDKYFFSLTCCNPSGWVPIKTILTFKRMREFQAYGVAFVAYALRRAMEADKKDPLVAVSEDGETVRRKRPLEKSTTAWARSAYIKGFGEEETEANTQEKIEEYCQQFGPINATRMRRGDLEDKGPAGKGRGKFKGSVFVEFAYEADIAKFLELETIPKFIPDGPEMIKMSKDAYVQMKAKEKGIPQDQIFQKDNRKSGPQKSDKKFNAFREMEKAKHGGVPGLAKIGDDVAIVGSRPEVKAFDATKGKKRDREDDGDESRGTRARKDAPEELTIEYKGATLEVNRHTGELKDPSKVPFEKETSIKFINKGEKPDWKELKAQVLEVIPQVFLAFPPGSSSGSIAKSDASAFSDAEIEQLREKKMLFGGVEVEWARMSEEEQREFWVTRAAFQATQAWKKLNERQEERKASGGGRGRGNGRGNGRGRGGRGGGGRGGGRGRGGRGGQRGGRGGRGGHGDAASGPSSSLPPKLQTGGD